MNDKKAAQSGLQSILRSKANLLPCIVGGFIGLMMLIALLLAGLGYFTRGVPPSTSGGDVDKVRQAESKFGSPLEAAQNVSESNYDTARHFPDVKGTEVMVELKSDGVKNTYSNEVKEPLDRGANKARVAVDGPPLTPVPPLPVELSRSNTTVVLPGAGRNPATP